jgi:hypothetical protein
MILRISNAPVLNFILVLMVRRGPGFLSLLSLVVRRLASITAVLRLDYYRHYGTRTLEMRSEKTTAKSFGWYCRKCGICPGPCGVNSVQVTGRRERTSRRSAVYYDHVFEMLIFFFLLCHLAQAAAEAEAPKATGSLVLLSLQPSNPRYSLCGLVCGPWYDVPIQ